MNFWTAAVIIVLIWGIVQIYTRRHDRDLGVTRDEDGNPVFAPPKSDSGSEETRREIERLNERIQVLERITTDAHSVLQLTQKSLRSTGVGESQGSQLPLEGSVVRAEGPRRLLAR